MERNILTSTLLLFLNGGLLVNYLSLAITASKWLWSYPVDRRLWLGDSLLDVQDRGEDSRRGLGVALDEIDGLVYWATWKTVEVCQIDGTGRRALVTEWAKLVVNGINLAPSMVIEVNGVPCSSFQYIDSSSMACTFVNSNMTDNQLLNSLLVKTVVGQVVPLHVGAFASARQLTHSSPLLLSVEVLRRNEEPVSVGLGNSDDIAHANRFVWSNIAGGGSIESMSVTGGNVKLLVEGVGIVTGLTINNGIIYFSTENAIMSLKTGETEAETVLARVVTAYRPMGLVMDGNLLLFSQESSIMRFDVNKLNDTAAVVYQGSSGSRFHGLAIATGPNQLDPTAGRLIFADYGLLSSIQVINMNGNIINSIMSSSFILWPRGLACLSDGSVIIAASYLGGLVRVDIDSGGNVDHLREMASESYRVKTEIEDRLRNSGEAIALTSLV